MANEVVINVKGRDTGAKQALDQTARQGKRLGDTLDRIGKIIGGGLLSGMAQQAWNKMNSFMSESIELAKEQARVEAQLDAVIRSTGGAAGVTADEVKAMASEYQNLTNFGDEAIISSSNVLMTFTSIGKDVFPRAQKSILDVSTALGQDLQQSTIQIGKALNNPIEGLTNLARAGVQFTEQQKEQIRTMVEAGDLVGAQTMILQELEKQFSGSAEAAVEADGGITQMHNSIGDMQEEIGAKLIPAQQKWTELQLKMLDTFTALPGPIQATVAGVALLSIGFLTLAPRIMAAKAALDQMGVSARTLTVRAGGVVALIAGIATAAQVLSSQFAQAQTDTNRLTEDVIRLTEHGRNTGEMLRLFGEDNEQFKDRLDKASSGLGRFGQKFVDVIELGGTFNSTFKAVKDDFDDLDAAMAEAVRSGKDADEVLQAYIEDRELEGEQIEQLISLLPQYTEAAERQAEQTRDATEAHSEATTAAREQVVALEDLAETMREQTDPIFALISAQEDVTAAQKAHTEAVEEYGKESPEAEAASLELFEAIVKMTGAAQDAADSGFNGKLTPSMRAALEAAGATEGQIDDIEDALKTANKQLNNFEGNYTANVHTNFTQTGRPPLINGRAPGGRVAAGGIVGAEFDATAQGGGPRGSRVLVGEQRPEVVELPLGSRVIPSVDQALDRGQGGGGPLHIVFDLTSFGGIFEAALQEWFSKQMRTNEEFRVTVRGSR